MAAVFDSAIDKACVAALEAAEADAKVAWLAAAVLLEDFVTSACSLLTCASRSAIRASKGLRSVHPAVIIRKAKMKPFPIAKPIPLCQRPTEPQWNVAHVGLATQWTFCLLHRKRRDIATHNKATQLGRLTVRRAMISSITAITAPKAMKGK